MLKWGKYKIIGLKADPENQEYRPDGNVGMSDEPQLVFLLTEMIDQQRKPDDQGCGSNDHSKGNQGQVLLTAGKTKQKIVSVNLRD